MSESKPLFERHKLGLETIAKLIYLNGVFPPWTLEYAKTKNVTTLDRGRVEELVTDIEMKILCERSDTTNIREFTVVCYPGGDCFIQDIRYGGGRPLDTGLYLAPSS